MVPWDLSLFLFIGNLRDKRYNVPRPFPAVRPVSYRWAVLLIACMGSLMAPLDSTIVSVSLPVISDDLGMSYASVVWVPTAYLVTIAALLLTIGRLSDLKGRKAIYIWGFGIFTLGSVLCSLATNGSWLIAARIVQGIGGACIMATGPAIITHVFPPQERGKALGINAMFVYVGLSLGPVLGGVLTGLYDWQAIFWVNVPIGLVVMSLAYIVIKEDDHTSTGSFDLAGAGVFALGLVSLLLALTFGEDQGWWAPGIIALFALSVAMGLLFIKLERDRGQQAMLNLQLFTRNRLFAAGNVSALLNYTAFFGVSFVISFYLQRLLELSVLQTGLVLLSMPVTMAIVAPISGWSSDRIGSRLLSTLGMVIVAAGLVLLSTLNEGSSLGLVVLGLVVLGIGMGMFASPNTSAIMGCVRKDQLGVASGTISTMRTVGQSLSLVIMGAVIAAVAGPEVANLIFGGGSIVDIALIQDEFLQGMSAAFLVGATIALIGAITSSVRGPSR